MRLSQYFLPVLKENPKEAQIASHRLMLRAGMIQQSSAGIYSWLPLGLKVLSKIESIVREEQNKAGAVAVSSHAALGFVAAASVLSSSRSAKPVRASVDRQSPR